MARRCQKPRLLVIGGVRLGAGLFQFGVEKRKGAGAVVDPLFKRVVDLFERRFGPSPVGYIGKRNEQPATGQSRRVDFELMARSVGALGQCRGLGGYQAPPLVGDHLRRTRTKIAPPGHEQQYVIEGSA